MGCRVARNGGANGLHAVGADPRKTRTDWLYVDLSARPSAESREVSPDVVIDYDAEGGIVGIDIDHASKKLDLDEVTFTKLPADPHRGSV